MREQIRMRFDAQMSEKNAEEAELMLYGEITSGDWKFSENDKNRILDGIDADLAVSGAAVAELPRPCRAAVALAQDLFSELARRLRNTPAEELRTTRVRVPNPVKARIAARAVLTRRPAARPASEHPLNGRQP